MDENGYISQCKSRAAWFGAAGDKYRRYYRTNRLAVFLLSVGTPAVLLLPSSDAVRIVATIMSLTVTALIAFESQFRLGEQWQHNRTAELGIWALLRQYGQDIRRATDHAAGEAAFDKLFNRMELLLRQEEQSAWPLIKPADRQKSNADDVRQLRDQDGLNPGR